MFTMWAVVLLAVLTCTECLLFRPLNLYKHKNNISLVLSPDCDLFSLQVDSSSVVGKNAVVSAHEKKKGGLLIRGVTGDFFRVWETKPQVQLWFRKLQAHLVLGFSIICLSNVCFTTADYLVCLLTISPVEQVLFLSVVLHNTAVFVYFVPPGRI